LSPAIAIGRNGPIAACRYPISSPAGIECKAALRQEILDHRSLTGSLHPKQPFKLLEKLGGEGRQSANTRHSIRTSLIAYRP